jgi:hypothetical protein
MAGTRRHPGGAAPGDWKLDVEPIACPDDPYSQRGVIIMSGIESEATVSRSHSPGTRGQSRDQALARRAGGPL